MFSEQRIVDLILNVLLFEFPVTLNHTSLKSYMETGSILGNTIHISVSVSDDIVKKDTPMEQITIDIIFMLPVPLLF